MYKPENISHHVTGSKWDIHLVKNFEDKFLLFVTSPRGFRRMVAKYDDISVANHEYNKTVTLY